MGAVLGNVPGLKPEVIGKPVETVYALSNRGRGAKLARGYDPFFRGLTVRGESVRLEDQHRKTLTLDHGLNALTPRELFHRRFGPVWRASQNVTVGGFPALSARLGSLLDEGAITPRQAEQAAAAMVFEAGGLERHLSRWTWRRRRNLLLDCGLALADDSLFEPVQVNLGAVFEQAMECPEWL
jgi:hypothetical protein